MLGVDEMGVDEIRVEEMVVEIMDSIRSENKSYSLRCSRQIIYLD